MKQWVLTSSSINMGGSGAIGACDSSSAGVCVCWKGVGAASSNSYSYRAIAGREYAGDGISAGLLLKEAFQAASLPCSCRLARVG